MIFWRVWKVQGLSRKCWTKLLLCSIRKFGGSQGVWPMQWIGGSWFDDDSLEFVLLVSCCLTQRANQRRIAEQTKRVAEQI